MPGMVQHGQAPLDPAVIVYRGVCVDRADRQAYVGGRELSLTGTEYRLLETLILEPERVFSRKELMQSAIADGAIVLERTIYKHIQALRAKLGQFELIETIRGTGYRFRQG